MPDVEVPRSSALCALSTHLQLLRDASGRSKWLSALCWLLAFGILFGHTLLQDIRQQRQAFHETASLLRQSADRALRDSLRLQNQAQEIAAAAPQNSQSQIRELAQAAAPNQPQLYFIGYQPLISQPERNRFEQQQAQALGKPYRIQDYLHDQNNSWRDPAAWREAPVRPRYLPLSMAEPGLASPDWREMGLDLLDDSVLSASIHQALGHMQAISPTLRLYNGEPGVALFQTVYRVEPPSPVPMVRIEQSAGVVMQIIYLKPLLALPDAAAQRYTVQLLRRDGETSAALPLARERLANGLAEWLPTLQRQDSLPGLPYDLLLSRQLCFERATLGEAALCGLFALLPAYLLWLALALLEQQRRARERSQDDIYREREYASVALRSIG
ncbi:hypothetical protein C2134_12610, partial [Chromobacterium sinusclupearum]